jgi:glutaredoxin
LEPYNCPGRKVLDIFLNERLEMGWSKQAPQAPLRVMMYTRRGCHLCEEARELLEELRPEFGFELELVDVDGQSDLAKLYGEKVPVVAIGGKERMWGRINRVLLERLLRASKHLPE